MDTKAILISSHRGLWSLCKVYLDIISKPREEYFLNGGIMHAARLSSIIQIMRQKRSFQSPSTNLIKDCQRGGCQDLQDK